MKWNVAGALVCVLSLVGCQSDVERPKSQSRVSIETPGGKVTLEDAHLDSRSVTASVVSNGMNVTFKLTSTGDDVVTTGGLAELIDPAGQLLFSIETRIDNTTGEVVMTQATDRDYLTYGISGDDERVYEHYDANGDVATFTYPNLSDDAQRRAVNYYEHGLPAGRLPADASEYVNQLGAFETYYEPHATSTLHDNPSGELLVQILTSPELPALVVSTTNDPELLKWIAQTCTAARACSALICRTNPASLTCTACTVISVACSILELICGWIGC